jgi:hypothetical protein
VIAKAEHISWHADGVAAALDGADGRARRHDQRDGEERRSQVDTLIGQIVKDSPLNVIELNGAMNARIREAINSLQGRVTPE